MDVNTCALTDMARYYRLPMFHFAGCTDAKTFDQQAALEGSLWMVLAALSGGNLVHDVGYIDNGLTASLQMLVTMDEVAGLVKLSWAASKSATKRWQSTSSTRSALPVTS